MTSRLKVTMILLPAVALCALGLSIRSIARSNVTDAAVAVQRPASASIVAGSGLVEPAGREVAVAAAVPGVVREVRVQPGDAIASGDILFSLDDSIAVATVDLRRQDLISAEYRLAEVAGRLLRLRADAEAARGVVAALLAERDEAADQMRTAASLVGGAVSQRELARRQNLLRGAEGRLIEAQGKLSASLADIALLDPNQNGPTYLAARQTVAQATAALTLAQAELDQRHVRSPRSGVALVVNIRPGEFAGESSQKPPIIVGSVSTLHVRIDVDEADVPRLVLGAPAVAARRGVGGEQIALSFVRAEPLLEAKRNLIGGGEERVDTRVLQLIYQVVETSVMLRPGQLLDVAIGRPIQVGE
ncbi:MAG: biotin/lipoyl-binding protein [Alphaproteobacteria bacterium]|nr:biotin/lipoyl-binding protein [Alphaproteobacteria bacterium]